MPGVDIDATTVETNIVILGVPDAPAFCAALEHAGVGMLPVGPDRVRAVTHLDVDDAGIERALEAAEGALRALDGAPAS
jgi:threonine aldolase